MEAALPIAIIPTRQSAEVFLPKIHGGNWFTHFADHFVPHARNNYHPHIFSRRMTHLLSVLLISAKIFTIALVSFGPVLPAFSEAITVSNIIDLTNQSRLGDQLAALAENSELDSAAQTKANDMLAKGYFSHTSPDGRSPWDFIVASGYNYITAGENLAVNFTEAENVETAWMNSPGHKANILNKNFQEIGIGISQGQYQGHDAIFVVQMFGTPIEQNITLSDEPTKVAQPASLGTAPVQAAKISASGKSPTAPAELVSSGSPAPANAARQNAPAAASPELAILDSSSAVSNDTLTVTAKTSDNAAEVLVTFGRQAIMLQPKGSGLWQGQGTFSALALGGTIAKVVAMDMSGSKKISPLADFTTSTQANYDVLGAATSAHLPTFAGITFNPKVFENQFYLLFIAAMLTSLVIAIAVHRRVQHVTVVANGALVVILAVLLWAG